mmetsp:Transcript_136747/g.354586  ORF Transcript_136747/g.354586 Transcript_136747/m.354586 type:complete len:200 (+) Transcript_136747:134-733(+)
MHLRARQARRPKAARKPTRTRSESLLPSAPALGLHGRGPPRLPRAAALPTKRRAAGRWRLRGAGGACLLRHGCAIELPFSARSGFTSTCFISTCFTIPASLRTSGSLGVPIWIEPKPRPLKSTPAFEPSGDRGLLQFVLLALALVLRLRSCKWSLVSSKEPSGIEANASADMSSASTPSPSASAASSRLSSSLITISRM